MTSGGRIGEGGAEGVRGKIPTYCVEAGAGEETKTFCSTKGDSLESIREALARAADYLTELQRGTLRVHVRGGHSYNTPS